MDDLTLRLLAVLNLFGDTLDAVFDIPILRFFLAVPLFFSVLSLLALMIRAGRRRGL